MAEGRPSAPDRSPVAEYRANAGNRSALEKVSMLVPNPSEETTVAAVASDADVSKETARKYLQHFENWNVVVRTGTDPETFVRNESYFEWLRVDTLRREHPVDELQEMLSDLAVEDERLAAEQELELGDDAPGDRATAERLRISE